MNLHQFKTSVIIFTAGMLLAKRMSPSLFTFFHATGHDYIKGLEAISLISERLADDKMAAVDSLARPWLALAF